MMPAAKLSLKHLANWLYLFPNAATANECADNKMLLLPKYVHYGKQISFANERNANIKVRRLPDVRAHSDLIVMEVHGSACVQAFNTRAADGQQLAWLLP
jgi:hypothetical protein